MKILFWTELFLPHIGGIEVFGAQLIKALFKLGNKVDVVASHSGAHLPDVTETQGIRIHRFHFQKALFQRNIKEIKQITEKIVRLKKNFEPDLIHINTIQPSLFFFYHTRTRYLSPSLITLHQPLVNSTGKNSLVYHTLSSADWITAVSNNLLSKVRCYAPDIEFKSSVIHNSLECPQREPSPVSFKNPAILCIGRLIKDKGFDLAIEALKKVNKHSPGVKLVISGDGPERKNLEKKAFQMGLLDAVHFTGWIDPNKVPDVMNKASIVVVPSRWEEPFGLVALQAAQMQRPVVASKTGGLPEIVTDKKTGLLFERENVNDLAEKILFLIRNPKKSAEMGKKAKKRAESHFNMEVISKKYDSLYKRLSH